MSAEIEVRALWGMVPSVGCRGLCVEACGPVGMSNEEEAILERRGVEVGFDRETLTCDQLKFGRCSIYEDRPLVCRLWGAVPEMRCPFGCEPTLTTQQGRSLMQTMLNLAPSEYKETPE